MAAPFRRSFRRSDLNAFYHKLPLRQQGTAQSAGGESRNLVIQCSPKRSKSLILPAFRVFIIPQSPGKMGLCKKPLPHLGRKSPFSGGMPRLCFGIHKAIGRPL